MTEHVQQTMDITPGAANCDSTTYVLRCSCGWKQKSISNPRKLYSEFKNHIFEEKWLNTGGLRGTLSMSTYGGFVWRCPDPDYKWHYAVNDCGRGDSYQEVEQAMKDHLLEFHTRSVMTCDKPIPGRLSLKCNQAYAHHTNEHYYVTDNYKVFGPVDTQ